MKMELIEVANGRALYEGWPEEIPKDRQYNSTRWLYSIPTSEWIYNGRPGALMLGSVEFTVSIPFEKKS